MRSDRPFATHRDDVDWYHAPLPPRNHGCSEQTFAIISSGAMVQRCACGAISIGFSPWMERNSSRDYYERKGTQIMAELGHDPRPRLRRWFRR